MLPFLVFFPMVGGIVGYWLGRNNKKARNLFASAVTAIVLLGCIMLYGKEAYFMIPNFCGLGLQFSGNGFRMVLAVITALVWFFTTIFSDEYFAKNYRNRNRYYLFMLLTLGATLGIFLSADFYTTFVFFEIMTFTSFVLVIHDESKDTIRAAGTYLAVAVTGGLVTLMGLFMLYRIAGTLQIDLLKEAVYHAENKREFYIAGGLTLVGFAAKASVVPLHIWLPEAYRVAPAPASALLACVLTKTGLYGVFALSGAVFFHDANWGMMILIFGVITMLLGAILAVFSVDLKRILACSSLSQIGFIMVGAGMQGILGHHNALAVNGSILHFVNHSFIKLALFMGAGVIYMNTREMNLNKIKGFGKDKPLLKGIFLMGILGIMGVPLWNGYISKTLLHESIVEYIHILQEAGKSATFFRTVEVLFLFAGGLTVAYMTKLFVAVFVEDGESAKYKGKYMNSASATVLTISAAICLLCGILPHQIQDTIAEISRGFFFAEAPEHVVHYFSWVNLQGAIISICTGAVVYLFFIRKCLMKKEADGSYTYLNRWPNELNLENKVYRPVFLTILPFLGALVARSVGSIVEGIIVLLKTYIFNNDDGKVIPPEDAYFSLYSHDAGARSGFREGLAKSLLFFGIGVTIAMLYMLL
ncbi:MAG: NADH dehydrogenase [Epulopiscium sp.]|nr:NADH dehydrogenase [Candidatus Epulonipiscium sp.]